jgi:hypothetical protein
MVNHLLIMVAVVEAVAVEEAKFNAKCVLNLVTQLLCVIIGLMQIMCLDHPHSLLGRGKIVHMLLKLHLSLGMLHGGLLSHLGSSLQHILHGNLTLFLSSGLIHQIHILGHLLNGHHLSSHGLLLNGLLSLLHLYLKLDQLIWVLLRFKAILHSSILSQMLLRSTWLTCHHLLLLQLGIQIVVLLIM